MQSTTYTSPPNGYYNTVFYGNTVSSHLISSHHGYCFSIVHRSFVSEICEIYIADRNMRGKISPENVIARRHAAKARNRTPGDVYTVQCIAYNIANGYVTIFKNYTAKYNACFMLAKCNEYTVHSYIRYIRRKSICVRYRWSQGAQYTNKILYVTLEAETIDMLLISYHIPVTYCIVLGKIKGSRYYGKSLAST